MKNPLGKKFKNPYDGCCGPTITVVFVEGNEAVCVWRYADNPRQELNCFVKNIERLWVDWIEIVE